MDTQNNVGAGASVSNGAKNSPDPSTDFIINCDALSELAQTKLTPTRLNRIDELLSDIRDNLAAIRKQTN